jgi:LysM repeat protein
LDGLWNSQNWPETIQLIEQILAADPVNEGMRAKLYAAHVNYGYQLLEQQQVEQARSQFELALEINPDGGEASLGLQSIPGGGGTIYIVLPGDTLFTIAQRFGTTVAAIQAANGLIGTRIDANQSLIIP